MFYCHTYPTGLSEITLGTSNSSGITHVSHSVKTKLILLCDTALKGNSHSMVGINGFCTAQEKRKEKLTQ